MAPLATVIYYTSNQERPEFEQRIQERLLRSIGDLPLISVSQKPMNFGYNICVGDIGVSNQNVFRQLQLGALHAETPFIISAEADCLYPPEYFQFEPPEEDHNYRYQPIWILVRTRHFPKGVYVKKAYSECGQMCGRKLYIKNINERLVDTQRWFRDDLEHGPFKVPRMWTPHTWGWYGSDEKPIVNVKTENGMHKKTGTMKDVDPETDLPYWGSAIALRKELMRK